MEKEHIDYCKDVEERFTFHPAKTDEQREAHNRVNTLMLSTARQLIRFVPMSPELDKAIDALEIAKMRANQAVAIHNNTED